MTLVSSSMDTSDDQGASRKIPIELTAYGTTPSGKPRLFVCQVCTRAFARLEHLRRHERAHTKEKPFSCGVCQRKFSRRDLLLRHAQKLHAGCADAITRLRRKSVKRSNSTTSTGSAPLSQAAAEKTDDDASALSRTPSLSYDNVNFNLDLFADVKRLRNNALKELQRQMVDKKNLARQRGASFSAQSGENYAVGLSQFNELYPGTDNIEFSTPQLMPSSFNDEPSWLNNISTIPGMNGDPADKPIKKEDLSYDNLQYMLPTATMNSSEMAASHSQNSQVLDYGYSFYDIPESMLQSKPSQYKPPNHLTPIKQEFEEDFSSHPSSIPEEEHANAKSSNYDINFINDIDELTNEFDVNSKFMGTGYSFYGDNPSASSSGPDATSPPATLNHFTSPNNFLNHNQLLNIENTNSSLQKLRLGNYSKNKLFTSNMRYLINKALAKYPISGALTPSIPSNERLEFYLSNFVQGFLSHFPFIHVSKLNEYEVMQMTSNEDPSNESARVCLPLLIATIGALLANNKNDSEHLYESSRRTVHIYLESRKSATVTDKSSHTVNPLWLIQSLTLSVIYGLFSDNENNVFIVIRQLNALNSLVKTSIKSKRPVLFSITGEDEEVHTRLSEARTNSFLQNGSLFSDISNINDELKFKNNIAMQSQYRIVLTIYRLTSFLLMLYNIPLTLSVNDLGSMELPTINDEFLWNFKNYQSYQEMHKRNQINASIDSRLDGDKIVFKDLLMKVSKSAKLNSYDISQPINQSLKNLSKFGFSALVTGVFEFNQFSSTLNTPKIINNLSKYIGNQRSTNCPSNCEKVDYSIVANFVKLSSLVNIKALKEQSWLRNHDELVANFNNSLQVLEASNLNNFDKILKYGMTILNFILFKVEETNEVVNLFGESDDVTFESIVNFKFTEEIDGANHSIYSQMLFHVFVVLAMMTIIISKQNKMYPNENSYPDSLRDLNQSFRKFFALLGVAENFLKMNYTNLNDMSMFYSDASHFPHDSVDVQSSLYILRIGQAILNYIYDTKFKVSIFQKLSGNMSKIEKYLNDNETKLL